MKFNHFFNSDQPNTDTTLRLSPHAWVSLGVLLTIRSYSTRFSFLSRSQSHQKAFLGVFKRFQQLFRRESLL